MSLATVSATRLQAQLLDLSQQALAFVPPDRPDQIVRQWLDRPRAGDRDQAWDRARDLAREVALMTASLLGVTALDRAARALAAARPAERALAELLRGSRLRLLAHGPGLTHDVAAEGAVKLAAPQPYGLLFGRFATLADGALVAAGPVITLAGDSEATAIRLLRPGRGFPNQARCAEAVYRHIARGQQAPNHPFDPEGNALDRLAERWSRLGRPPGEAEFARARPLAGEEALEMALHNVPIARECGLPDLATAYRHIAAVMVDTLSRRAASGSGHGSLDAIAARLDARIARGEDVHEIRTLLRSLRDSVRMAGAATGGTKPGGTTGGGGDLDRLVARIQALRAKTVEQGCTEQEALAAAEKVAELLDRYGLSLSELDLRQQACEGIGIETGRKRRGPIDDCMGTIAWFFDCRVWSEVNPDGTLRYIFFGMPADVQATVYLHDLVVLAFATETAGFQAGPLYRATPSGDRRNATTSFQTGLARGIAAKLRTLRETRDQAPETGAGRALVPVKQSVIDQELERLGLTLRRRGGARRHVQRDAYSAGKEAGERFEYRPGIPETGG